MEESLRQKLRARLISRCELLEGAVQWGELSVVGTRVLKWVPHQWALLFEGFQELHKGAELVPGAQPG